MFTWMNNFCFPNSMVSNNTPNLQINHFCCCCPLARRAQDRRSSGNTLENFISMNYLENDTFNNILFNLKNVISQCQILSRVHIKVSGRRRKK